MIDNHIALTNNEAERLLCREGVLQGVIEPSRHEEVKH